MSCAFGSHAWVFSHALDTGHTVYRCHHCGKDQWRDPGPLFNVRVTLDCGDTDDWSAEQHVTWIKPGTTLRCSIHGERTVTHVEQEQVRGKKQSVSPASEEASDEGAALGCLLLVVLLILIVAGCGAVLR